MNKERKHGVRTGQKTDTGYPDAHRAVRGRDCRDCRPAAASAGAGGGGHAPPFRKTGFGDPARNGCGECQPRQAGAARGEPPGGRDREHGAALRALGGSDQRHQRHRGRGRVADLHPGGPYPHGDADGAQGAGEPGRQKRGRGGPPAGRGRRHRRGQSGKAGKSRIRRVPRVGGSRLPCGKAGGGHAWLAVQIRRKKENGA